MTKLSRACRPFFRCLHFLLVSASVGPFLPEEVRAAGVEPGSSVVVVYNRRVPESKEVAEYYAKRRQVPANQVIGLDLPTGEAMTHDEFVNQLQHPLTQALSEAKIFEWSKGEAGVDGRVVSSKIRYAVLCYGVPVKVLDDTSIKEAGADAMEPQLRHSGCAVDSQLALLPLGDKAPWLGFIPNPFQGATNALYLHPTNGVLMVARLDGPSSAIARGLVDKAMEAETNGLWGRAYFDARGLTNGPYLKGDAWIRTSAQLVTRLGLETTLDEHEITWTSGYPMSQIAFYAGWYDQNVSGPFTRPEVEFMPGAFAYHLHSFSAQQLRTTTLNWVGPLLAKGATASIGFVAEPYLAATLDLPIFFGRLVFFGNSYGESAYAAQPVLSWQTTVVGDPLYRPFWQQTDALEKQLRERDSPLVAWSNLMEANQNLALGGDKQTVIKFLQKVPLRHSPILQEKVGDLFLEQKRYNLAAETYEDVLKLATSKGQRLRVLYSLGEVRSIYGPDSRAYDVYEQILKENPDYPEKNVVYEKLIPLARRLGRKAEEENYTKELSRLTGAVAPSASGVK